MEQQYKYFAFISYSSLDTEWGKQLQRKLEHYRMPSTLCSEHGWQRTPIRPVFFAPSDIQLGGLAEELQEKLQSSKNLIVICSPNSAQSKWVGKEIEFFHQLGRTKHIHFFIVEGSPHSGNPDTECYNPIVNSLGLPEILGANIHEKIYRWPWLNKERAYVQLISKLLEVEFDTIWQRHRRLLVQKMITWAIGILIILSAVLYVWTINKPTAVEVRLNEASVLNPNLPPLKKAVITLSLENEIKTDTIHYLEATASFINIPHRFLNKLARIKVACQDYFDVDTTIVLSTSNIINIRRNPSIYGNLRYRLWKPDTEQTAANTLVVINGHSVTSDTEGYVNISIPLKEQKETYSITSNSIILEDSVVSGLCGPNDVIIFK